MRRWGKEWVGRFLCGFHFLNILNPLFGVWCSFGKFSLTIVSNTSSVPFFFFPFDTPITCIIYLSRGPTILGYSICFLFISVFLSLLLKCVSVSWMYLSSKILSWGGLVYHKPWEVTLHFYYSTSFSTFLMFLSLTLHLFLHTVCCCCQITSVVSDSVRPQRRQPTRSPQSLGFSRQEHWSGLPFPSPMHESEKWKWSEVAHSCSTPSDTMDCSLPGPSVYGIFQARVLEWGAIAFSSTLSTLSIRVSIILIKAVLNSQSGNSNNPALSGCNGCSVSSNCFSPPIYTFFFFFSQVLVCLQFCWKLYWVHGECNGIPLQYSCLENPVDRGAW